MAKLQQVAAQGNPEAQAFLGFLYTKGQDVRQNDAEAVKWFQSAAVQGYARAQFRLGDMYREGRGVPQNYLEAVKWWSQAAEQGDTRAQCGLGDMYRLGQGVPQNFVHAYLWLNLCSASTQPGEFRNTSMQHRDEVAMALSPEQLGQAQALASQWQPRTESESFGAQAR
jgi:TPR repeat protein